MSDGSLPCNKRIARSLEASAKQYHIMSKQQDRGLGKWLKRIRSFGFIQAEDGSADVYTHYGTEEPIENEGQYQPEHRRRRRR